ncbi:30S ribosomal protein S4 [Candidatus Woesearchaeota archaeon]|nr:30S ribosomal protein S4 [Candidatus Woesearchaeota archaeon]
MGDPKKFKKKYNSPRHPWNKLAIEQERVIRREYGLKNKREIYIATSFLKKYRDIAKKLIADSTSQGQREREQMLNKLTTLGMLPAGAKLDDILSLELKDIMERRLQSLVLRKGFSKTAKQARQFITHRHVIIGDKEITSPSYIVSLEEESHIRFKPVSSLADEAHPERIIASTPSVPKPVPARSSMPKYGSRSGGRSGFRQSAKVKVSA